MAARVLGPHEGRTELVGLDRRILFGAHERLRELFPGHDAPVAVTWFSGELVAGHGEATHELAYYTVVYQHYRVFHVLAGRVQRTDEHESEWYYEKHGFKPLTAEELEKIFEVPSAGRNTN